MGKTTPPKEARMQGKTCSKCSVHYNDIPENFKAGAGYRDGFQGICKACGRENERRRYARTKEQQRARRRARVEAMELPAEKTCRTCGECYSDVTASFHRHNSVGLHPDCKVCRKVEAKAHHRDRQEQNRRECAERYRQNRDEYLARNREWRERNREEYLEKSRAYYSRNREEVLRQQKAARDADPEPDRQRSRDWRRRNPEQMRALNAKHRRIRQDAPGSHTADDIRRQYEAQRGFCYWCKKHVKGGYHVDHVIPLSKGGSNGRENIVVACPPCNLSKKDKMPAEFAGVLL